MDKAQRAGEVIEASTIDFVAQCYELYQSPPLGSLVKTIDTPVELYGTPMELYGMVYNATTTSIEPGRRPIARGKDEPSEEEIYRSSPQLLKLLRSEFSALVVGHRQGDKLYQYLPPKPARIHSFVYPCTPGEVKEFSRSFNFLNILINARLPVSADELIAASLRQMSQVQEDRRRVELPRARVGKADDREAIVRDGPVERAVLRGVSASVPVGGVLAIVGVSGSGKSFTCPEGRQLTSCSYIFLLLSGCAVTTSMGNRRCS